MQFRDGYYNAKLADIPYLLPYGQAIADHATGMRLNSTSARLWDAIRRGADREELLALLKTVYEAEEADIPELQKDLDFFLSNLYSHNVLLRETAPVPASFTKHLLQIGPLRILLKVPEALWEKYFSDFACGTPGACETGDAADQQITLFSHAPISRPRGQILLRSEELIIAETDTVYLFLPVGGSPLTEMHVTKDGAKASLYCPASSACYAGSACSEGFPELDLENLFHTIRFAFLVIAAQHGLYAVHSASLLYRGKAWLFSGRSGVGKSTHTGLWQETFGTPLLNGDLNLIGLENGVPMCYGLPWCGTSGIRTPENFSLGGIVFLKQYPENKIMHPSPDQKILYLLQRMISPAWTEAQLQQTIGFCESLCPLVPMFRLYCTKDAAAAQLMKSTIDACPEIHDKALKG